jgi:hypothetical protein
MEALPYKNVSASRPVYLFGNHFESSVTVQKKENVVRICSEYSAPSPLRETFKTLLWIAMVLMNTCASTSLLADPVTWGTTITVEPSDNGAYMHLLHLQDGSWLSAASAGYGAGNTYINVRRSTNDLRTWTLLTTISESGRDLDNPVLAQLPNGNVLLSDRSVITNVSTKIEVWTATNVLLSNPFTLNSQLVDDIENPNQTTCPFNKSPMVLCGVWEPYLFVRNDGTVLIFYTDEAYQQQGYSQVIAEKTSTNGGQTWGGINIIVSQADDVSRPGMPHVTLMENGLFMLTYEVGNSNGSYPGSYKTSSDGTTWAVGLGSTLPTSIGNPVVQSFSNGMLLMTSNNYDTYYSGDYGATWTSMSSGLTSNFWNSMYQTRTNEVALVVGPTIRIGTMAPMPYHDAFASNSAPDYTSYGGSWSASGGVLSDSNAGQGDKVVMVGNTSGGITGYAMHWRDYTVQADLRLHNSGNAGFLIRASNPATGADSVDGYYVGADTGGIVVLGNEAYGYTSLSSASIPDGVPTNTWLHLTATVANCTISVTAQLAGSTNQAHFSYTDSSCAHMNGTIGLRTFNTAADWRNVTVDETGIAPSSSTPYLAPFASGSSSGWTTYGGTWSISNNVYQDTNSGQGDKSVVSVSTNANLIVQSDVEMSTVSGSPNSGILLGVSNPAVGPDSLDGFYIGTNVQSLVLGYESYAWRSLAFTPYENALSAGQWVHVTAQTRGCVFTVTVQPLSQTYGYLQSYVYPSCTTPGSQGVREFNAATGFQNFSVLPN